MFVVRGSWFVVRGSWFVVRTLTVLDVNAVWLAHFVEVLAAAEREPEHRTPNPEPNPENEHEPSSENPEV